MKRLLISTLLLTLALISYSQERTLFDNAQVVGGFGSFFTNIGKLNGQEAVSAGGGGGVVFSNFFIGGYGEGITQIDPFLLNGEEYRLSMGNGGIWLGFTYPSTSLVHVYLSGKFGFGGMVLQPEDDSFNLSEFDSGLFVAHPELGLELNVASWFRLVFTGGYRFVNNFDSIPNIESENLRDWTYGFTFRFGHFSR